MARLLPLQISELNIKSVRALNHHRPTIPSTWISPLFTISKSGIYARPQRQPITPRPFETGYSPSGRLLRHLPLLPILSTTFVGPTHTRRIRLENEGLAAIASPHPPDSASAINPSFPTSAIVSPKPTWSAGSMARGQTVRQRKSLGRHLHASPAATASPPRRGTNASAPPPVALRAAFKAAKAPPLHHKRNQVVDTNLI